MKDVAPVIATGNDVIKSARDLYPKLSCHVRGLYQRPSESQKRMSDPAPPERDPQKKGHSDIVHELGIDPIDFAYQTQEGTEKRKQEEDIRQNETLNAWIERGCKNKPKETKRRRR